MAKNPQVAVDSSGALTNEQAELFALHVADGLGIPEAWRAAGPNNENSASSLIRRKYFQNHPLWLARVEQLQAEREALGHDKYFGHAIWMIHEVFRFSRAQGDLSGMRDAAKMRLQVAMKTYAPPEADLPEPQDPETPLPEPKEPVKAANVGAPSVQSPQSSTKHEKMRADLIARGIKSAPISADEDA